MPQQEPYRLAVVDDDKENLESIVSLFKQAASSGVLKGWINRDIISILAQDAHGEPNVEAALTEIDRIVQDIDVIVSDLYMPTPNDGFRVVKLVEEIDLDEDDRPLLVMISNKPDAHEKVYGYENIHPWFSFYSKPAGAQPDPKRYEQDNIFIYAVSCAVKSLYQQEASIQSQNYEIIHESNQMKDIFKTIEKLKNTSTCVLLTGESGTGKELVARAIHESSPRKDKKLVTINCAAIPDTLIESELLGYEKGAFTGAHQAKRGKFDLADGSTLFLDEIGDMSLAAQAKVLRVLQEGQFSSVGGDKEIKVDVRVIAATNKNLEEEVEQKRFREDLYYRLNKVPIELPPLRDRGSDDINSLIDSFLKKFSKDHAKGTMKLSGDARQMLLSYNWPGNIRELENVIERLVILSDGNTITDQDLKKNETKWKKELKYVTEPLQPAEIRADVLSPVNDLRNSEPTKAAIEKVFNRQEEKLGRHCLSEAAKALDMRRNTLRNRCKRYGITIKTNPIGGRPPKVAPSSKLSPDS